MKPTNLQEHPEGGRFKEVYRSKEFTHAPQGVRATLTHIYFSLNKDEVSHFHKVTSDEVWNLYKGSGLYLYEWDGSLSAPRCIEISEEANCFCHVIPAGYWQAAVPISDEVLVGCSVAPGFDFTDFTMITPESVEAKRLHKIDTALSKFIPKTKL